MLKPFVRELLKEIPEILRFYPLKILGEYFTKSAWQRFLTPKPRNVANFRECVELITAGRRYYDRRRNKYTVDQP